nr:unnamed protein product [Callosobruchus chinensis]
MRESCSINKLLVQLRADDIGLSGEIRSSFKNFLRMSTEDFENLICLVGPAVAKRHTNFRNAISVTERLAITLRFLATGDSYHSLMYLSKISKQSISVIIPEVCKALIDSLSGDVQTPTSETEWKKISDDYEKIWNFPHCLGAMDGKHVVIEAPIHSGSEFYNYKGTFSIVLFAIANANYNFLYASVGCQGRISDGGVFKSTSFHKLMEESALNRPKNCNLLGRQLPVPYVLVADDAFPLTTAIMKPYSGHQEKHSKNRVFNYRLSRARRVVENVFEILAAVFRVLRKPMLLQPEKAEKIVLTCVLLHNNYLRKNAKTRSSYNPPGTFDKEDLETGTIEPGSWRRDSQPSASFLPLMNIPRKASMEAWAIRDEYAEYFMTNQGQVPWQLQYC